MRLKTMALCVCIGLIMYPTLSIAQIKPETSGASSFNEPEMRPHQGGEYRPNEPRQPTVGHPKHRHRKYSTTAQ